MLGVMFDVWANVFKLCFYVYFKPLTTLNVKNHRKICLFKFHSSVPLHCSVKSLIWGASRDVSGFYHRWSAMFCLSDFPLFCCVKFLKVGVFKYFFKCWSVVSEFGYLLKNNDIQVSCTRSMMRRRCRGVISGISRRKEQNNIENVQRYILLFI